MSANDASTTPAAPLPPVDGVTQPWWDATREQRLLVQRCTVCGRHQHYPRALCTRCGATDGLGWTEVAGTGTVDSFTVVHRGLPGFPERYVVARVRLDLPEDAPDERGPVLLANLVDEAGEPALGPDGAGGHLRCDQPVRLAWRALGDGRHLPVFVPEAGTA